MSKSNEEPFNFSTNDGLWNILLSTYNFLNATTSLVQALNKKFEHCAGAPPLETKLSDDEANSLLSLLEAADQIQTSEEDSSCKNLSVNDRCNNLSVNSNFLAAIDYEMENIIAKPPEPAPQVTSNKRFDGTLRHQVVKKPQLQKQLIEYSRTVVPKPDKAIQKLKTQLAKMYECHAKNRRDPSNPDGEKIADDIRVMSEMVANLERERQIKYSKTVLPVKKPSQPAPEPVKDTKSVHNEDIKMVQTSYKTDNKEMKPRRFNSKPIGYINLEAVSVTRGNRISLKPVKIEVVTSIANEDVLRKGLKFCNHTRRSRLSCK
ncbi:unnamed protein product [Phyllotreta striolata]|uniref:Uncharacterized protein n=1 Tax=Phyllotreta striolata TaxID=444603 RepID=A0A9N9TKR8_PHYSR|nr:unnamed protein product [Phyllotreta striolata]